MPFTPGGIFYRRIPTSPTLGATSDGRTASETFMMSFNSVDGFIAESLPLPIVLGPFILHPPKRTMIGRPWLRTDNITVNPWYDEVPGNDPFADDDMNDVPASSWASVNINYKTAESEDEDETDPETFLTHRVSIGAEFMTLPKQKIRWHGEPMPVGQRIELDPGEGETPGGEPPKAEDIPAHKIIPQIEHTFTWKEVINPPWDAIIATVGRVNKNVLFGTAKEYLLFLGVDASREYIIGDVKPWTLEYRFTEKVIAGWNHFFRPETGMWERVKIAGNDPYEALPFAKLFQAA